MKTNLEAAQPLPGPRQTLGQPGVDQARWQGLCSAQDPSRATLLPRDFLLVPYELALYSQNAYSCELQKVPKGSPGTSLVLNSTPGKASNEQL